MDNRITKILGIEVPLVQAPMNWINDAAMVAAVSEAGALGVLGPNAGPKTDSEGRRIGTRDRVAAVLHQINSLTSRPYGLNIISDTDEATVAYAMKNLDAAREAGVRIFAVVGTYSEPIYHAIKDMGGIIMHRELNPTPEAVRRAEAEGADIIVATGHDEGGLLPAHHVGTFTLVPQIVDAVKVPVLAAGGINDIRGVRAALALGAEGVYVGSRFVVADECPAAADAKQLILDSTGSDLIYVSPSERSLPTDKARQLNARLRAGEAGEALEAEIHRNGGLRPAMLEGRLADGIVSVNTGIGLINSTGSVRQIVDELMADFRRS